MQVDPVKPLRTQFVLQLLALIRDARAKVLRGVRTDMITRPSPDIDTLDELITQALHDSMGVRGEALVKRFTELGYLRGIDYTLGQLEREVAKVQTRPGEIPMSMAIDWTQQDLAAINELSKLSFADLKGVQADVGRKVLRLVIDGDKQGLGITKIAQGITEQFNTIGLPRAELIARTSINASYNKACFERIRKYAPFKIWIDADDSRVRPSHKKMHYVIIPVEEPFIVPAFRPTPGSREVPEAEMMYPGDVSFKPDLAQILNCRCTLGPKFKNGGKRS